MLKNTRSKRGFTIVELVIVIAVIAILAAVLIPTFSNIIHKAQKSSDTQLIRNLNEALAIDCAEEGLDKHETCYDAFVAADEAGYNVAKIVSKSGYNIAWEITTGHFVLLDEQEGKVLYPVSETNNQEYAIDKENDGVNYFVVRYDVTEEDYVAPEYYSLYCGTTFNAKNVTLNGVGFDAGAQTGIETVTYQNEGTAHDVVIRTSTFDTVLTVNGSNDDTVTHYGYAGKVTVSKVAQASYDEYGIVGRLVNNDSSSVGHIAIKSGATVYQVVEAEGNDYFITIEDGATVYGDDGAEIEGTVNTSTSGTSEDLFKEDAPTTCKHDSTHEVIDSEFVYEVCDECGYTVIRVRNTSTGNETKKAVTDEIMSKATYSTDQVSASSTSITASEINGVKANEETGKTGKEVTPLVEETPEVIGGGSADSTHVHSWSYATNSDGYHTKSCSCGSSIIEKCDTTGTNGACSKCGYKAAGPELPATYSIGDGETYTLSTFKGASWATSDSSIVSVSDGVITANGVGTATITANGTAECVVTVNYFHGGTGTEADPYQIASAEQFSHIHDIVDANNWLNGVSFKLVADIDYSGKTFPAASKDRIKWDSVVLDGNNHKISNANAMPDGATGPECLLGNYYCGLSNVVKDLTIENCTFNGLFYASWNNSNEDKLVISNVTIKNSTVYDGSFVNWSGYSRVEISDSSVVNTTVSYRGWAGSIGGFIGNGQNVLIEDSKMINSSVVGATGEACGGFISQSGTNVEINNCLFDANSVVKNISSGCVYAIGGTVTSYQGNEFYGMLICSSKSKASISGLDTSSYSVDSLWNKYNTDIVAANFTFNSDGTITYNGSQSYDKFTVTQRIWTSNCTAGVSTGVGGFQKDFDKHEFTSNSLTYTKLTKIQQYAPNATVAAMLRSTTTDSEYIKEEYGSEIVTGGTVYIDNNGVLTTKLLDADGNGQYVGGTLLTNTATTYNVTVIVTAISGESEVGTVSFTYSVPFN